MRYLRCTTGNGRMCCKLIFRHLFMISLCQCITMQTLNSIQQSMRFVFDVCKYDHISSIRLKLNWLPIRQVTSFLTFLTRLHTQPPPYSPWEPIMTETSFPQIVSYRAYLTLLHAFVLLSSFNWSFFGMSSPWKSECHPLMIGVRALLAGSIAESSLVDF